MTKELVEQLAEQKARADANYDAWETAANERDEWKVRAEAAEHQASEFKDMYEGEKLSVHQVCDRAEKAESLLELSRERRAAAEAECAALRAELKDLRESMTFRTSLVGRLESECAALRAEVKELASERDEGVGLYQRTKAAAESSLAAATELLERWMADEDHSEDGSVRSETRAFLAAQPAAPARTEVITGEQAAHIQRDSALPRFETEATAAPARTEAEFKLDANGYQVPTEARLGRARTEAERRVLDAMVRIPESKLQVLEEHGTSAVAAACKAELARREAAKKGKSNV